MVNNRKETPKQRLRTRTERGFKQKQHIPRKRFGQNFLENQDVQRQIVAAIHPESEDHIIEIGPGQGALTKPLLESDVTLDCLEIDRDLVSYLKQTFGNHPRFCVHSVDALKFDITALATGSKSVRVVGNLPYNVTTPLLFHLLNYCDVIKDMHFMLQKEVVERITALPNCKAFGRLTLMMQYFCKAEYLFTVPREAFRPVPKVESAFLRLVPHITLPFPVKNFKLFEALITTAFNQRRKMLSSSLKGLVSKNTFVDLQIDPKTRPEQLPLEAWVKLCNSLEVLS